MNTWGLDSAVIPVTGAASGIGLAICKRLRAAGARPLLLDVHRAQLEDASREIYADADASRHGYVVDVSDPAAVDACFDRLQSDHGPVTHAVANAGILIPGEILELTNEAWQRVIDVNLSGVMYTCRAAARQMARQGHGAIVTTGSISGIRVKEGRVAYAASKAGVMQLTSALAIDLGGSGIRVNGVAPGVIDTPIQSDKPAATVLAVGGRSALKRVGTPDEIAKVVLFLLSDFASYVSGHTIIADGGLTLRYT